MRTSLLIFDSQKSHIFISINAIITITILNILMSYLENMNVDIGLKIQVIVQRPSVKNSGHVNTIFPLCLSQAVHVAVL